MEAAPVAYVREVSRMEGPRFDAMARLLARATTRRSAITAAVAAAFGGAALATDGADARPALCRPAGRYCTTNKQCCNNRCRTGKRVPIASRNICDCDAPFAMCGKLCRDLSSDPNNCGGCGIKIDRETEICCDGVPTLIDSENCGTCGEVCGPDDVCCAESGGCADLQSDPNNCGECGNVCDGGECTDGECGGSGTCNVDPCTPAVPTNQSGKCIVDIDGVTHDGCQTSSSSNEARECTQNSDCSDYAPECGTTIECYCSCGWNMSANGFISFPTAYCSVMSDIGATSCT